MGRLLTLSELMYLLTLSELMYLIPSLIRKEVSSKHEQLLAGQPGRLAEHPALRRDAVEPATLFRFAGCVRSWRARNHRPARVGNRRVPNRRRPLALSPSYVPWAAVARPMTSDFIGRLFELGDLTR